MFTVDFSLDRLAGALEELQVSPNGRVFVATSQGAVLIGRRGSGASRAEVIDRELALATVQRSSQETEATFEFDHHGEPYLGRAVPLTIANLRWLVEVVVPERDYTAHVDAEGRLAIGLGVLALVPRRRRRQRPGRLDRPPATRAGPARAADPSMASST